MARFQDLPFDILPLIISQIDNPSALARLSLVNAAFNSSSVPLLYHRIAVYSWHKHGKAKVMDLFDTLSTRPGLAKYVRKLEIRDFPRTLLHTSDLSTLLRNGLQNCANLRSLTWTRDGTLFPFILETLGTMTSLRELEINGHDTHIYDPDLLLRFKNLEKISLVMPSPTVVARLEPWTSLTSQHLLHLTLICKSSPLITDELLRRIALSLVSLEHLHLAGCIKVTEAGILPILSHTQHGLISLGLEGLSPKFDMSAFAAAVNQSSLLRRLKSITVTSPPPNVSFRSWIVDTLACLHSSPVESFSIYSTIHSNVYRPADTDFLCRSIVDAHGERMKKLSVHRFATSVEAINDVCARCPILTDLFITIAHQTLGQFSKHMHHTWNLRVLHINIALSTNSFGDSDADDDFQDFTDNIVASMTSQDDLLSVVRRCGQALSVFGCNTRVWKVERCSSISDDGKVLVNTILSRYDSPDIPEQFLVVRTS